MEKETKYYTFNYSKDDEDLIVELKDYLDQKKEDIFNFFDSTLQKEKVTINIIPTKKEYDEIAKKIRKAELQEKLEEDQLINEESINIRK